MFLLFTTFDYVFYYILTTFYYMFEKVVVLTAIAVMAKWLLCGGCGRTQHSAICMVADIIAAL